MSFLGDILEGIVGYWAYVITLLLCRKLLTLIRLVEVFPTQF